MRIWDIDPRLLCAQHLLGEHRELHGLWNILTLDKQGYRRHPETRRWEGKLGALFARHARLVREMVTTRMTEAFPMTSPKAVSIVRILLEARDCRLKRSASAR